MFAISNTVREIIIPVITIPSIDLFLCLLFGAKARWFQLHSVINAVIVGIIYDDVIKLYRNPLLNNHAITCKLDMTYIMWLHLYHLLITKNITCMDYFHHIVFVGFGCLPAYLLYDNNLLRLGVFATCGFTGAIEYFSLALVKHGRLTLLAQKRFNSHLYNYVRYPLSMYSVITIYIVSLYDRELTGDYPVLLFVINVMIFMNGAFYNKLTVENYIRNQFYLTG